MNDGQVNEQVGEDLELVDMEPATDEQTFEDLVAEEARSADTTVPLDTIRETTFAADTAADRAAREAGRRVMQDAYEGHRVLALAAVETMLAHAQLALAALKWDAENVPVVAGHLIQADRQLRIASHAVEARLQLSGIHGDGLGKSPIPAFSING